MGAYVVNALMQPLEVTSRWTIAAPGAHSTYRAVPAGNFLER
jgi:hypothetical protein